MDRPEPRRLLRTDLPSWSVSTRRDDPLPRLAPLRIVNRHLKVQRRPKAVSRRLATALQDGKRGMDGSWSLAGSLRERTIRELFKLSVNRHAGQASCLPVQGASCAQSNTRLEAALTGRQDACPAQ